MSFVFFKKEYIKIKEKKPFFSGKLRNIFISVTYVSLTVLQVETEMETTKRESGLGYFCDHILYRIIISRQI